MAGSLATSEDSGSPDQKLTPHVEARGKVPTAQALMAVTGVSGVGEPQPQPSAHLR